MKAESQKQMASTNEMTHWIGEVYAEMQALLRKQVQSHLRDDWNSMFGEDLVSEVFVLFIRKAGCGQLAEIGPKNWREPANYSRLRGWLFTATQLVLLASIRRERRLPRSSVDCEALWAEVILQEKDIESQIRTMLKQAAPRGACVIQQTFFDGRADSEIAKEMGIHEANVRLIRHRMYLWLKTRLKPLYHGVSGTISAGDRMGH